MTEFGLDLTSEWNSFLENSKKGNLILDEDTTEECKGDPNAKDFKIPKCNDIYISTKTKQNY